jgi:hypothetical protein
MQTFLPYPSFSQSAESLDKKRCWKQVVETKQILCSLRAKDLPEDWVNCKTYQNKTMVNHPAVQMWKGNEELLKHYYNIFLNHCIDIHKINTEMCYLNSNYSMPIPLSLKMKGLILSDMSYSVPFWLNNDQFHRSHRSRLYHKDPIFYNKFEEDKDFNEGRYWWPDTKTGKFKII